jgi:nucleoside-specific outer membrane channel protein Tsx
MKALLVSVLLLITSLSVQAVSFSLLKGNGFRDDLGYRSDKTTLTIENFTMWELGTVFFYYDITEPTTDDAGPNYSNQFFGGISPTFSLTKMTGKNWSYGFIRDVSIRIEYESGSGNGAYNFRNYFYGLQYDLAVPGFDFFSFNTVLRDSPKSGGVGWQLGAFWQMSWDYGPWKKFRFTGFLATSPENGDPEPSPFTKRGRFLTSQPQLLYDVGQGLWNKPNRFEVGFEYAYFLNRFQQDGKDEKVLQYMTKISF